MIRYKEKIVLEYLNGKVGGRKIAEFYEVEYSVFRRWVSKYKEYGIEGLKSKTGKALKTYLVVLKRLQIELKN